MSSWILILAGGGGTRLWPMSRRSRPKQFLPLLDGGESLLGATVRRVAPLCPVERVIVVTAASQVALVREALPDLPAGNIVVEPVGRNTAPAIGLGLVEVLGRDPAAVVAVLPSDQHVADEPRFLAAVEQALDAAARGHVVTIGVRPTRPETGYGYIQHRPRPDGAPAEVLRFVEKPDRPTAEAYLRAGDYLWNAGMFFFPAAPMLAEIARQLPPLGAALEEIRADPSRTEALYPRVPAISIDYAVMEKLPARAPSSEGPADRSDGAGGGGDDGGRGRGAGGMRVIPGDFGWSDVGSWDALGEVRAADESGNACLGEAIVVEARRNVVAAEAGTVVALVGVDDLVVVATGGAVLVMPRARAQDVRRVVAALEAQRCEERL